MNDEIIWVEKYRPNTVADTILPERIKKVFQDCVDNGATQHMLLVGRSGVGKTTIAKAMCDELGIKPLFINSSEERGIDTLRVKIRNYASTVSLSGKRKVIICDEADGISGQAQDAFRGVLEEFANNVTFIFTANYQGKLLEAIHSRCAVLDFTLQNEEKPKMAMLLLKRVSAMLKAENIEFEKPVLIKIIEQYFPDYRRTINELQRFSKGGKIDAGTLVEIQNVRNFEDLVGYLKEKDFGKMRRWVAQNSDIDFNRIYRRVYDALNGILKPEDVPQAVVILAKYQYQGSLVADQEINTTAMFTELMVSCQFQ